MQALSRIIYFGETEKLFTLFQGYCFSKHIEIMALEFNMAGIRELCNINPDLILLAASVLFNEKRSFEVSALKRDLEKNRDFKVGVIVDSANIESVGIPVRFDFWLENPHDLGAFEYSLNSMFGEAERISERRFHERRSSNDRRNVCAANNPAYPVERRGYDQMKRLQDFEFKLDTRRRCLFLNTQKVELTPKEYGLIELLMTDANRVFLPEEIIRHLWPENKRATKSDLYQYMYMLRKKIEDDPNNPKWLTNIKGHGYKLNLGE
jgi:Transcriptional regulatory protein, C terminal